MYIYGKFRVYSRKFRVNSLKLRIYSRKFRVNSQKIFFSLRKWAQWAFVQRYVLDKLLKRPMRFLVALYTLDKFFDRHAQVEDVTTRFGSVLCSLQISYINVLYVLKKTLHMRYIGTTYLLRYFTFFSWRTIAYKLYITYALHTSNLC